MVVLSVRGATRLVDEFRRRASIVQPAARVAAFITIASVGAMAIMIPWCAATKYYRYRGISGEIRDLGSKPGIKGDLVFVRSGFATTSPLFR